MLFRWYRSCWASMPILASLASKSFWCRATVPTRGCAFSTQLNTTAWVSTAQPLSGGRSPYPYLAAFGCHLFLSTDADDVRSALDAGFAAATILSGGARRAASDELRIAFDGDAVLFSDESERVYQMGGLEAFQASERQSAREPLRGGPFKPFLAALNLLQKEFPEGACPIRTALVTARSAPAHERVIRTLREWDIRLDESLFLGGLDKSAFLEAFAADVFFDDQAGHCERARSVVATGHVPHGISNEPTMG